MSLVFTNRMNVHDIGMHQPACGSGLRGEPGDKVFVPRQLMGQHLDGNRSVEVRIISSVNIAHASAAQPGFDSEMAQFVERQIRIRSL